MGQEAACVAHAGGRSGAGKALLESEELIFRGDFRLVVPFRDVTEIRSQDGVLALRTSAGESSFELGPLADKWAEKIRNPRTLLDKLGVKSGQRVSMVGLVDEGFVHQLRDKGAEVLPGVTPESDIMFFYAPSTDALTRLAELKAAIKRNGAIWVVSPRGDRSIQEGEAGGRR